MSTVLDLETKAQLDRILTQIKEQKAKGEEEFKKFGTLLTETKEQLSALQRQADALDIRLSERHSASTPQTGLKELLTSNDSVMRLLHDRRGSAVIELPFSALQRKTLVDSSAVGSQVTGVLQIDRTSGITPEARQTLRIRQALTSRPTTLGIVDFLRVQSGPSPASMQTESSSKAENAVTFSAASEKVQTCATLLPTSKQCLDDMSELMGYLENMLPYEVALREELEILHGSGAGNDLHGLVVQASAFNSSLLTAVDGWNKSDQVCAAIQQIAVAKEVDPTFIVCHPTDFYQIRRLKDSQKRYLFAGRDAQDPFWGLDQIVTTSMGVGNFMVGSGSPVATEIRDRTGMMLEISTQHSTFFAENKVMFRAERRLALVTYRPGSFVFGTFASSPA